MFCVNSERTFFSESGPCQRQCRRCVHLTLSRLMWRVLPYCRHHCLSWSCSIRYLLYLFYVPSQTQERKCRESRSQSRGMIWVMLRDGIVPYSLEKVVKRAERLLPAVRACRSAAHRWHVFLLFSASLAFFLLWLFSVRFRSSPVGTWMFGFFSSLQFHS